MKDLLAFQDWAVDKGHYSAIAMLKNYFNLLENRIERTKDTSKDNKEARERKPRSDQLDNCE